MNIKENLLKIKENTDGVEARCFTLSFLLTWNIENSTLSDNLLAIISLFKKMTANKIISRVD